MKLPSSYDMLGVAHDVTVAALKKRYRELAFTLHPDRNPAQDAAEQFARVSVAYEHLLKRIGEAPPSVRAKATGSPMSRPCKNCRGKKKVRKAHGFNVGPWEPCRNCK